MTAGETIDELVRIVCDFQVIMAVHGDWVDGCFYYSGKSASELESIIQRSRAVLAAVRDIRKATT
jgi:hypothetical protein